MFEKYDAPKDVLAAITYDALELMGEMDKSHAPLFQKWKETRDKALRKNLMLDAARKKLFQYLDAQQIWRQEWNCSYF